MKNIKYILTFLTLVLSVNIFAQTPFPSGIRFPNLKQVTAADSIPVFGANGILKSWIHKDSIGAAKSLQEVTDVGYTTTNPIETSSYLQSGLEVTVPNQKKYLDVLRTSDGNQLITYQTEYWNTTRSQLEPASNVFVGKNAGLSSYTYLSNGFGENALRNNTGHQSNGFGSGSLTANKGNDSNGFGYFVLYGNLGERSNGFGNLSLYNNTGADANAFGSSSLSFNKGRNANGFGNNSLNQNLGNNANGFGYQVLRYNDRNNNTALGHEAFGSFYDDVANKKDVLPEDVQIGTKIITITNHGFVSNNRFINLRYTTTGTPISYLSNNQIYQIEVLDNNTIAVKNNITDPGTGIHTFTPQYQYTNSTTIGANSHPTDSNQITLGDSNVTEIDTYGRHRSRAYGQGHVTGAPTYNLAVDSAGRFIETAMGGGMGNLQQVTDLGYITTNPIEVSNYVKIEGEYVTSALFNENKVILKNDKNLPIIKEMKTTYNGTSLVSDVGLFLGENSGNYNKGRYSNGFGRNALQWNTGINSSGFGDGALSNNKGDYSNGFGHSALNGNEGNDVNGFGRAALMFNEGNNSNGYGSFSLQYNLGNDANGFGNSALNLNKGNHANGFGTSSLRINIGDNATGIGERALTTNSGNNNTALGHNSFGGFYPNSTNAITINTDNTSPSTSLITIPSHNLGPANSNVLLRYSSVNNALSYGHMSIQQFLVIDSNTLKAYASFTIRNQGDFILTPSYIYSNSTALGANSNPNKSNQVVLGDPNVTEITMGNRSILNAIETPDTLSEINLSAIGGNLCNMDSANSSANYDVISTQLNGNAIILINCSVQPTITGGTLISGDEFTPDTDMYMNVRYMGIARGVEYSFKKI